MNSSPFAQVLSTLWKMLNRERRVRFVSMLFLLFLAGLLDMTGMLLIFGYIAGLRVSPSGERGGRLAKGMEALDIAPLSQQEYVLYVGGLVVLVLLIKNALSTLIQFYLNKFLMKLNQRVSEKLFDGYLRAPYELLNAKGSTNVTSDINRIFEVFSTCFSSVAQILADGTMLLTVVVLLCLVNPLLTLSATVLFGGLGAALYWWMQRELSEMGKEDRAARKVAEQHLSDGILGLIDTRLRGARKSLVTSYSQGLARTALLRRRTVALERLPRSMNEIMLAAMIVAAVSYLTYFGDGLDAALPTLGLFGFAGLRMTSAMSRVNRQFQKVKRKAADFQKYYDSISRTAPGVFGAPSIESEPSYLEEDRPLPAGLDGRLHQCLSLKDVSFTYPGAVKPALQDIRVTIPAGSFVGLCGTSGGGKSTLALLLMGLVRPQVGTIRCDDWSIFNHIRAWHSRIGYVGQSMYIASRSVRENVAFAESPERIDDQRVWNALKMASAEGFVRKLPKKLNHVLRNNGGRLSGGQRQRIAIARALYHDPDLVVFDEATAALDNITEREISEAIGRLSGKKTVVCVAHRLSTIRKCDSIYLVEEGTIRASGSYEELLETSSAFRGLVNPS